MYWIDLKPSINDISHNIKLGNQYETNLQTQPEFLEKHGEVSRCAPHWQQSDNVKDQFYSKYCDENTLETLTMTIQDNNYRYIKTKHIKQINKV